MGNIATSPCLQYYPKSTSSSVKLIYWEGATKILKGKHIAGEIMFESPDKMVCHADSFFIGHPVPALGINDKLIPGKTYFILPIDRVACSVFSPSTLAALSPSPKPAPINFGVSPFEYIHCLNGRVLIKVLPEFIISLIYRGEENGNEVTCSPSNSNFLCSTPELKKHYDQLVGSREQVWSPKLETITEHHKIRFSPCRFIGLERKRKEN